MHFVTTADVLTPEGESSKRLAEVGYRLDSEGENLILFRRAEPFSGSPLSGEAQYVETFSRVNSLNLQYLHPESEEWQDSWQETNLLPLAVKISLKLALDAKQQEAVQRGGLEIPLPEYEAIVSLPTVAALPEDPETPNEGEPQ